MSDHCIPDSLEQRVTGQGDEEEDNEQENIEAEYHDRYPIQPSPIVRKIVEENRHDTGAHGNTELQQCQCQCQHRMVTMERSTYPTISYLSVHV